jgi:ABC-type Fe3+ transport system substrate-binding protein
MFISRGGSLMKITGMTKLAEILEDYPETMDVFLANGFEYPSAEAIIETLGRDTMLRTILRVREMNLDLFLYHLETAILKAEKDRLYLLEDFTEEEPLDFYGNTICPLKFTFKDALEEIVKKEAREQGNHLKCYVEAGRYANGACGDVLLPDSIDKAPGLLLSKEFNDYLGYTFRNYVCGEDHFAPISFEQVDSRIKEAGIIDEEGEYGVYAVMAENFFIDMDRLGDMPVPRTLSDLLKPVYQDNIIIFGKQHDELSNAVFLYIYKEFGEEGLKKFAHNVKGALHGSVMSKTAGTKKSEGGAIYLVSGFFANTCIKENVQIIWPEDGAIVLPMYFMVKQETKERVQPIVDYLMSEEYAAACVKAFTPAVNGKVQNCIPENGTLKWLGWDYIRENNLDELVPEVERIFMKYWKDYHPGERIIS